MVTPLEKVRTNRGLSKVAVAKAVGCNKSHYGHIEAGRQYPSPELAAKIASFFGNEIAEQQIIYPMRYVVGRPDDGPQVAASVSPEGVMDAPVKEEEAA